MSFAHFGIVLLLFGQQVSIAEQDSLVFAQVFFRNGLHALETGDVCNKTYNETDLTDQRTRGDLTKAGKQQEFELGQFLKKRYEKLVPTFSLEKVQMESSLKNRSLESAELVLAGMFPPKKFQIWKGQLDSQDLGKIWIPIPVQSNEKITNRDSLGLALGKCPVFENFTKSAQFSKLLEDFSEMIDYFCNLTTCKPPERLINALHVSSALVLESFYPGSEPEWANENLMKNASEFYWAFHSAVINDFKIVQLSVGWLLEGIIAEMEQVQNAKENHRTFHGYSMQIDSLNALLASLTGLSEQKPGRWPSFGAFMTVELYKTNKNDFQIKAFYWDKLNSTENEVAIADCKNPCSLKKFKQISKKYFVDDWEEACGLSRRSTTVRPPPTAAPIINYVTNPADKALTGFLVIFVLLFLASVGVLIWMRKKMRGGAEGSLLYNRMN